MSIPTLSLTQAKGLFFAEKNKKQTSFSGQEANPKRQALNIIREFEETAVRMSSEVARHQWLIHLYGPKSHNHETQQSHKRDSQIALDTQTDFYDNPAAYKRLIKLQGQIHDPPTLQQQLRVLLEGFKQAEVKRLITSSKQGQLLDVQYQIAQSLNQVMGLQHYCIQGQEYDQATLLQLLETTRDKDKAFALWQTLASKGDKSHGSEKKTILDKFRIMAILKNTETQYYNHDRTEPFRNYYHRKLDQLGISETDLFILTEQIAKITHKPYQKWRQLQLGAISKRFRVGLEEASKPWFSYGGLRYLGQNDFDSYLAEKHPVELAQQTADTMGESLEPLLKASQYKTNWVTQSSLIADLHPKSRKSPLWFCLPILPPYDVRVNGNISPALKQDMMQAHSNTQHETLGHGLDFTCISQTTPPLLQNHHPVITESRARLFENLVTDPKWLKDIAALSPQESQKLGNALKQLKLIKTLLHLRQLLVVIHFEKSLYENPNQDLSHLWWTLQNKYLGIKCPREHQYPFFTNLPHLVYDPVSMQNDLMAECLSFQQSAMLKKRYGEVLDPDTGKHIHQFRTRGNSQPWLELAQQMVDEPLSTKALHDALQQIDWNTLENTISAHK